MMKSNAHIYVAWLFHNSTHKTNESNQIIIIRWYVHWREISVLNPIIPFEIFCFVCFFFNIFILIFCVILFNSFFGFHFDKLQCNDSNGCLWYLHLANFLATYRLDFLTVCLCTFTVCIWWQSNEEYIFWCIFSLNYSPVIP